MAEHKTCLHDDLQTILSENSGSELGSTICLSFVPATRLASVKRYICTTYRAFVANMAIAGGCPWAESVICRRNE